MHTQVLCLGSIASMLVSLTCDELAEDVRIALKLADSREGWKCYAADGYFWPKCTNQWMKTGPTVSESIIVLEKTGKALEDTTITDSTTPSYHTSNIPSDLFIFYRRT